MDTPEPPNIWPPAPTQPPPEQKPPKQFGPLPWSVQLIARSILFYGIAVLVITIRKPNTTITYKDHLIIGATMLGATAISIWLDAIRQRNRMRQQKQSRL